MKSLYELIYASVTPEPLNEVDISELLTAAQKTNSKLKITGLLCYDGRRFLQLIEGPEDHVKMLYQSICKDTRHQNIDLLHENAINSRSFENWEMAYELFPHGSEVRLSERIALVTYKALQNTSLTLNTSFGEMLFSKFENSEFATSTSAL